MKRRITRIKVETEREVIVGQNSVDRESLCIRCGRPVALLDRSEAESLFQLSLDEFRALIQREDLHVFEIQGRFLICSSSLPD